MLMHSVCYVINVLRMLRDWGGCPVSNGSLKVHLNALRVDLITTDIRQGKGQGKPIMSLVGLGTEAPSEEIDTEFWTICEIKLP